MKLVLSVVLALVTLLSVSACFVEDGGGYHHDRDRGEYYR